MFDPENFKKQLFSFNPLDFDEAALQVFQYQWKYNNIYQKYCSHLGKTPKSVKKLVEIPFLPIELFKSNKITTEKWTEEKVYMSSGTTSKDSRSKHYIKDNLSYLQLAKATFEGFFGSLENYTLMALLPSYLEQGDSSLISMVDYFMKFSKKDSGYFGNNHDALISNLEKTKNEKICLFGVTYALLDLAKEHQMSLPNAIIIETGGMKGRRKEIIRRDLHSCLQKKLNPDSICSEYGMTELTSQAYSQGELFSLPNWSKVLIRDINDPFTYLEREKIGGINIIDFGNIHSCSFIETKDLGKVYENGQFEVLGRYDHSDIRGCNLMVSQ
ncbi:MAG: acyl transferase [Cyclobacteriaceae bacterium]